MQKTTVFMKKKLLFIVISLQIFILVLLFRVVYIQTVKADELQKMAYEQQTRDRLISPKRGSIYDRNGVGIAITETVNAISVIPAQVKDKEGTAKYLAEILNIDYDDVIEKVNKKVALVRIKTKVDFETSLEIRKKNLAGVVVDEDVKRVYPYNNMASQIIGFVGKDNQGIIGLEAKYEEYLKGEQGKILTLTDSKGLEFDSSQERIPPKDGYNLITSIDVVIQQYAEQTIKKAVESKRAKKGLIIVLNPKNGEIYAMANYPNFNLNEPFKINNVEMESIWETLSEKEKNEALNQMWRNTSINDTYEPGSTFKTVTSAAALEEGLITPDSNFNCKGSHIVGDRMIKCWRYPRAHGLQSFTQGVQNSCNPVFMELGERLGAEKFYEYMNKFGFNDKTGIDLSGEAVGIMHKLDNVGPVELATMSFGQSFQITPLQLLRAVSSMVNGGYLITPHIGCKITDSDGNIIKELDYGSDEKILSDKVSEQMKSILETVVSDGTGNKAYIPGYRIGGKTATSEKLPRRSGKYIASFLTFAPAENPEIMSIVLIDEPQGTYYGGTVAGPVMQELLLNILPYIGVEPIYNEKEAQLPEIIKNIIPNIEGLHINEAKELLKNSNIDYDIQGDGDIVSKQFPPANESINIDSKVTIYTE